MNIGSLHLNRMQMVVIVLLFVGLIVGIYLLQTKQIFRSRATDNIIRQFSVTGQSGGTVTPDNNGNFTTNTLKVRVNFTDPGPIAGDGSPIGP